jgi:hypothetical protein
VSGFVPAALVALRLISGETATPVAEIGLPLAPGPEQCLATPLDPGNLAVPPGTTRPATPPAPPELEGTAMDEAVTHAVEGVIVEVFACLNAGEPLRAYTLYSDAYLRQVLAGQDADDLQQLATPALLDEEEWTVIVAIRDIRLLEDGRVYATVVLDPALIPVQKIFGFFLVREGDRWLVDDVLDELEFQLP